MYKRVIQWRFDSRREILGLREEESFWVVVIPEPLDRDEETMLFQIFDLIKSQKKVNLSKTVVTHSEEFQELYWKLLKTIFSVIVTAPENTFVRTKFSDSWEFEDVKNYMAVFFHFEQVIGNTRLVTLNQVSYVSLFSLLREVNLVRRSENYNAAFLDSRNALFLDTIKFAHTRHTEMEQCAFAHHSTPYPKQTRYCHAGKGKSRWKCGYCGIHYQDKEEQKASWRNHKSWCKPLSLNLVLNCLVSIGILKFNAVQNIPTLQEFAAWFDRPRLGLGKPMFVRNTYRGDSLEGNHVFIIDREVFLDPHMAIHLGLISLLGRRKNFPRALRLLMRLADWDLYPKGHA